MHVVFLTSAFPHDAGSGVDMVHVRRARELARRAPVTAVVPTPWVPPLLRRNPRFAAYAGVPRSTRLAGVPVFYPRYVQVPGMGPWAGASMALGALPLLRRLRRDGLCDVVFAQAILPDGLAAVLLGRETGAAVACLGRGSDVNLASRSRLGRWLTGRVVRHAAAVGTVAHELAATLARRAGAGTPAVLYNGIDLDRFAPGDARPARLALDLDPTGPIVLFVGRLVPGKGLFVLVDAFARLTTTRPDARLVLVGDGPLHDDVVRQAWLAGVSHRVTITGAVAHERVADWMRASDVLVLPSEAEGFPNVVREALACGRPVVATAVGDVPRIVGPETGRLVPVGDAAALATALAGTLATTWDPAALRRSVAHMTWEECGAATHRFLCDAIAA